MATRRPPPPLAKPVPKPASAAPPIGTTIEEIEPRNTDDWVFVHKWEGIRDYEGNDLGTLWFSEREMRTSTSDTPANTRFRELIEDPGDYQWSIFGNGRTPGLVIPSRGSVSYKNAGSADGVAARYFDDWAEYVTDGAKLTCYWGPRLGSFPAEFRKIYIAYGDGYPEVDDLAVIKLRGREKLFDRKVATAGFTDDSGSENGVDLEKDGVAGSAVQQVAIGEPPPFKPILLNADDNVWFVQANEIDESVGLRVFDGGGELSASGGIGTSQGGGTFRALQRDNGAVFIQPVTQTRVELRVMSSGVRSTPMETAHPWTICDLARLAGIPADASTMATGSTNYSAGNRLCTTQSIKDVLNDVAAFQVAVIGMTWLDEFFAKPILPSFEGSVAHTFRDTDTYSDGKVEALRLFRLQGMEKRVYQLKVRAGETSRSSLVGDVPDDDVRDQLSRDGWMTRFTVDHAYNSGPPLFQRTTILDSDPTAESVEVEIKGHEFRDEATMLSFGARLMALHGSRSVGCSWEAHFNTARARLQPLDVVAIQTSRYGGSRRAILIAGHAQLKLRRIAFTGWSHREEQAPVEAELTITQSDIEVGAGGGGGGSGVAGQGDAAPQLETFMIPLGDKTTAITASTPTQDFLVPYDMTLTEVGSYLSTLQTSGTVYTQGIKANGTDILSTPITVDNNERSSLTAATPPVISAPSLNKGDLLTFPITAAGTGGKGPVTWIKGYQR